MVLTQIQARSRHLATAPEPDHGAHYRDYLLGSGRPRAVCQLVDRAFALAGFELEWELGGRDPARSGADFPGTGSLFLIVEPRPLRPSDPLAIRVDPSLARKELGWTTPERLDTFLSDMPANNLVRTTAAVATP